MDKNIQNTINEFLINVNVAEKHLSKFSKEILSKDKKIHKLVNEFNTFINSIEIEKENNEFNEELQETLDQYKLKSNKWNELINSYIDGKEFINKFEKSLLVVVFGNVNVGKSSIGNFIAGASDELREYYEKIPNFYLYDFANNKKETKAKKLAIKGFKENYTEETTSIQYYTLNKGLTWVDSPGIHSINGENEELAKKYVDYADLVIFVMSSSSPAKHDEFLELGRLINKQKPLLVIINKSDKNEVDEVDGKIVEQLVAKSKSDRKKQEDYVRDIFKNKKLIRYTKTINSISISTKLAKVALVEDDNNKFILSGIPSLYDKLGEILKNDTFELKKQAPIQRINSIIDELINGFNIEGKKNEGISQMKKSFEVISKNINKNIDIVEKLQKNITKEVKSKSEKEIDLAISRLSNQLQCGKSIDSDAVRKKVEAIVLNNFNIILQKHIKEVLADFKFTNIKNLNLELDTELKNKYETITYQQYDINKVSREPKGIIEHIGALFGKKYREHKRVSYDVKKQIVTGDNSIEVIENIVLSLEEQLTPIAKNTLNEIATNYFEREKNLVNSIVNKLSEIEANLNAEKINIIA